MSETVSLTEEQRRALELLDFTPSRGRCEVRWRMAPSDCGRDADGVIVSLHCDFTLATSRACWTRTMLVGMRGITTCGGCRRTGRLLDLFEFRPFGEVAS